MRRARGHTLIELTMSTGILAVIGGGIFTLMKDSGAVFGASLRSVKANRACTGGMHRLRDDVELADPASLAISTTASGDRVKLQVPLSITNGVIAWGGRCLQDNLPADFPDATVEYRVASAAAGRPRLQLLRRLLDPAGAAITADEVIVDDVDEPDNVAGKGFTIARAGRMVTTTIRVRLSADDDRADQGEDLVRSQQTTIRMRNP
jgi:hypothetical protein